ncbi:Rv3235 family protein [Promicromonospora sp. NPDC060204]|uniref:Rv3235 family protein n=1 Tax=Promicromonospora sp. NPDC060204 TaxID=3347071 RepID=UPI0036537F8B
MTTLDSPPEAAPAPPRPGPATPAPAPAADRLTGPAAPSRTRRTTPRAAAGSTAPPAQLPAQRPAVPPAGPVTGPGIGRRLRRMRIGGTPYPELQNAAAALEALSGRPVPEPDPTLPDPTAQVCRVVRAAVEVLRGERPAAQLARWVTPQVYDQLLERGRLMREARQVRPPRPKAHPAAVRRVRLVRLGATSAEATVILHDEGRVRAAAVRLEARRGVWRVAVLEIG